MFVAYVVVPIDISKRNFKKDFFIGFLLLIKDIVETALWQSSHRTLIWLNRKVECRIYSIDFKHSGLSKGTRDQQCCEHMLSADALYYSVDKEIV